MVSSVYVMFLSLCCQNVPKYNKVNVIESSWGRSRRISYPIV